MRDSPGGPAPVAWPGRRTVLTLALGVGVGLPLARLVGAQDISARGARPQPNDRFVLAAGERKGRLITLADLPPGGAPLTAYPKDATTGVVRDDSRLNQILLVRLDPSSTVKCPCHFSEFDLKASARVLNGPASRRLPALPLKVADGLPVVAGAFIGRPGFESGGG